MSENKCRICGTTPAYISFLGKCECSNPKCECYSEELYPLPPAQKPSPAHAEDTKKTLKDDDITSEPTGPIWLWSNHHNDCGD